MDTSKSMEYRVEKQGLLDTMRGWDSLLKKKVHLIACGGTALTLLGVKESTKDIDLMAPNVSEYNYLIKTLEEIGYKPVTGAGWSRGDGLVFDLFRGNKIHTTELLESPLEEENHILIKEFSFIYLGALNYYDIIISKLFRGASVDIEDCLALMRRRNDEIDINLLTSRFKETASFDVSEERVSNNLSYFISLISKTGGKK